MGDFRKKNTPQNDFGGKNFLQGNTWRKKSYTEKKFFDMAYNAGKNLTPLYVRKINYITRTRFLKAD